MFKSKSYVNFSSIWGLRFKRICVMLVGKMFKGWDEIDWESFSVLGDFE